MVDEGDGDRYHHAQGGYLPGGLTDEYGARRWMTAPTADHPGREAHTIYAWQGDAWGIYLRTDAEMEAERVPPPVAAPPTGDAATAEWMAHVDLQLAQQGEQLESHSQQFDMLLEGVTADG